MIYKNAEKLSAAYGEIVSKIYNEEADADFQAFKKKAGDLIAEYADRDEEGNIKFDDNKQVLITEKLEDFKKANDALVAENKAVIDARNNKITETNKYLELNNEYSMLVIGLADFPADTVPGIVGIFADI